MRVVILILFCFFSLSLWGQKKPKPIVDYLPTENLEGKKDANKATNRPDRKRISLLYVGSADRILYGNACATAETHRMGFEYIVEPQNGRESKSAVGKFLNNLWVKTKLTFRRSPFWKVSLNNRIKKCRRQTGDFVG
ncbi:MAG: hypothetical protein AAF616_14240 [Bacteroidota bacterium]